MFPTGVVPFESAGIRPGRIEASRDGRLLAIIDTRGDGWLVDARSGASRLPEQLGDLCGVKLRDFKAISFSPDSRYLAWIALQPLGDEYDHGRHQKEVIGPYKLFMIEAAPDAIDVAAAKFGLAKNFRLRNADQGIIWAPDSKAIALWHSSVPDELAVPPNIDCIDRVQSLLIDHIWAQQLGPNLNQPSFNAVALLPDEALKYVILTLDFSHYDFNPNRSNQTTDETGRASFRIARWHDDSLLSDISFDVKSELISAVFSSDARRAAVVTREALLIVDTMGTVLQIACLPNCAIPLRTPDPWCTAAPARFSGDGRFIAIALKDCNFIIVYVIDKEESSVQVTLSSDGCLAFALSDTGSHMTILRERCVEVWRLADWDNAVSQSLYELYSDSIGVIACSPDGEVVVTCNTYRVITVWNDISKCPSNVLFADADVASMAISRDKMRLALAFAEDTRSQYSRRLQIRDLSTGTVIVDSTTAFVERDHFGMVFSPKGDKVAFLTGPNLVQMIDISSPMARNEGLQDRSRYAPWAPELILGPFGARCATLSEEGVLVPVTQILPWRVGKREYTPTTSERLAQLPPSALDDHFPAYLTVTENWIMLGRIRLLYLPPKWAPTWTMSRLRYPGTGTCSAVVRGNNVVWGTRCRGVATLTIDLQHQEIEEFRWTHDVACAGFITPELYDYHDLPLPQIHPSNGVIWTDYEWHHPDYPNDGKPCAAYLNHQVPRDELDEGRPVESCLGMGLWDYLMTVKIERPITPKVGPLTPEQMAKCMVAAFVVETNADLVYRRSIEEALVTVFTPGPTQDKWLRRNRHRKRVFGLSVDRLLNSTSFHGGILRFPPLDDELSEASADSSFSLSNLPPSEPLG